jgi:type VI protein secretion system component VasK
MGIGSLNTQDNPATTAGTVTAGAVTIFVAATMGLAEVFDVRDFTQDQYTAVGAFIVALWTIMIPTVLWIRSVAWAPSSVEAMVDQQQADKVLLLEEDPTTQLSPAAAEAMAAPVVSERVR